MSSPVDTGIAAIVAKLTAISPANFQVLDGGATETENEFVIVGSAGGDAVDDLTLNVPLADHIQRVETFDVSNVLSVWIGDADVPGARARALGIFNDYRAAFRADPRLGGAVIQARITSAGLNQGISGEGAVATVTFAVNVTVQSTGV